MNTRRTGVIIGIVIILIGLIMIFRPGGGVPAVVPDEAERMLQNRDSVILLDVRTPSEYSGQSGHLEAALLIPLQELEERIRELEPHRSKTIIAYCRSGNRSGTATSLLNARGFHAVNLAGGIIRWTAENRAVTREGKQ